MKVLTYTERGKFALLDKPVPRILDSRDAIVRVTLGPSAPAICTSSTALSRGLCRASAVPARWKVRSIFSGIMGRHCSALVSLPNLHWGNAMM